VVRAARGAEQFSLRAGGRRGRRGVNRIAQRDRLHWSPGDEKVWQGKPTLILPDLDRPKTALRNQDR
jgi:hypothetical protein